MIVQLDSDEDADGKAPKPKMVGGMVDDLDDDVPIKGGRNGGGKMGSATPWKNSKNSKVVSDAKTPARRDPKN